MYFVKQLYFSDITCGLQILIIPLKKTLCDARSLSSLETISQCRIHYSLSFRGTSHWSFRFHNFLVISFQFTNESTNRISFFRSMKSKTMPLFAKALTRLVRISFRKMWRSQLKNSINYLIYKNKIIKLN